MKKHLEILFSKQEKANSEPYKQLMGEIDEIANAARAIGDSNDSVAKQYASLKKCEYEFLGALTTYVPTLLQKEAFFKSAFKN